MAASHHVDELLGFLATAGQKGWINRHTATSLKGACERVFGVLDPEEKVDVAKIDVDAVVKRFANRNSGVSSQSLAIYGSRIRNAVKMFTEAKSNPTGWKPPAGRSARAGANGKPASARPSTHRSRSAKADLETVETNFSPEQPATILDRGLSYPFPLRADVTITISNIPRDLRASEVDRIAQFLKALALGDQ